MSIATALLPEFDQEMANTRKILELVPEDRPDYKPHEKSMTLSRLAAHVAEIPSWASATIGMDVLELDDSFKPFVMESRAQLVEHFDKCVKEARAAIESASDEHLAKNWTLRFGGKNIIEMPRVAVIRSMVMNHLIHHRAQLGVYLRLNDIAFPGMYGASADDPKWWEATA